MKNKGYDVALTVSLCTANAAFVDDTDEEAARILEVARILRDLATKIENRGMRDGDIITCFDVNGNAVGRMDVFRLDAEAEE